MALTAQALRLLSYLVDCRDRVVPRSELLTRGRWGDRERALGWLDRGLATAERFGSHGLERRILRLIDGSVGTPSLAATGAPAAS